MKKIILASGSPRRQELLRQVGLEFEVIKSDYQEEMDKELPPQKLVEYLSAKKAEDVLDKCGDGLVVAADTVVDFSGKILGKPHTVEKARETLRAISGQKITVITGYTIVDKATGEKLSRSVATDVYVKELTDEEIAGYVATGEPLDKAGAFAIQGKGAAIVSRIEGDYHNIMGLPLSSLLDDLQKFNLTVF